MCWAGFPRLRWIIALPGQLMEWTPAAVEGLGAKRATTVDRKQHGLCCRGMEIQLSPEQQAFVRQNVESGRLQRPEEAAQEAFSLWAERERSRAEILAQLDIAEAQLARGECRPVTKESMQQLAEEVMKRGRARLAADQRSPR